MEITREQLSLTLSARVPRYCKLCGLGNFLSGDFALHKLTAHPAGGILPVCEICGKRTHSAVARRKHLALRHQIDKPYKCTYCKERFSATASLTSHRCDQRQAEKVRRYREKIRAANTAVQKQCAAETCPCADEAISAHESDPAQSCEPHTVFSEVIDELLMESESSKPQTIDCCSEPLNSIYTLNGEGSLEALFDLSEAAEWNLHYQEIFN